ncbi:MAG TPA: methyltransferase domain-containing protein [Burkholderiales bacterium]|nr:methyltransferase domain-containing protein [Burkholderiales bacterium]
MTDKFASFIGSIPEYYDTYCGPAVGERWAEDFVRRLPARIDGDVLETACGTGTLTRRLRDRLAPDARLVATDLNGAMLEYARRRLGDPPRVEWQTADAVALPFPDRSFGAVVCQLGIMFVPDKAAAMHEAHRVLAPGGLFAFHVWDRLDANPHAQASGEAIAALLPNDPVASFIKVPYGFNDESLIRRLLADSGFTDVRIERAEIEIVSRTARSLAIGLVRGTPRGLMLEERGLSLDAVVDVVATALARVGGDNPFHSPARALVVMARAG